MLSDIKSGMQQRVANEMMRDKPTNVVSNGLFSATDFKDQESGNGQAKSNNLFDDSDDDNDKNQSSDHFDKSQSLAKGRPKRELTNIPEDDDEDRATVYNPQKSLGTGGGYKPQASSKLPDILDESDEDDDVFVPQKKALPSFMDNSVSKSKTKDESKKPQSKLNMFKNDSDEDGSEVEESFKP